MPRWFRYKFFHRQSNPTSKQDQHLDIAWQNIHFNRIKTEDGAKHCVEHSSRCCLDFFTTNISNMVHFRNGRLHEWPGALRSVPQMSSTTSLKRAWATAPFTTFALGHIGSDLSCGWGNYSDISWGHRKWWCKIIIKTLNRSSVWPWELLLFSHIFATSLMGGRNKNYSNLP